MSPIKMDIQVEGLDGLRRRLGSGSKTLDQELKVGVRQSGEAVKAEGRKLAKGNRLPNSVQMRALNGGLTTIVGSVAKSAESIERGRKPGEWPGIGPITAWIKRYHLVSGDAGIGAAVSLKTHRLNKPGRVALNRAARDMAWKIAVAVERRGTKALPFIIPAGEHKVKDVQHLMRDSVGRALARIAR